MSSLPGSGGPAEKQQVPEPPPPDDQAGRESDQGETEDEEIKMNCIGGQCGMHDSDFSSDGGVDADSDEGEERDTSREDGVVDFVSGRVNEETSVASICRPKPIVSKPPPNLSPLAEENSASNHDSDSSDDAQEKDTSSSEEDEDESQENPTPNRYEEGSPLETQVQGQRYMADCDEEWLSRRSSILEILETLNDNGKFTEPPKEAVAIHPKAKRVLSSNTLASLNADAGRTSDLLKRMKPSLSKPPSLPELSLGLAALDKIEPILTKESSAESDELDKRLSEELDPSSGESSRENSPVPLLTPPQSPLTIDVGEGMTTVCEWPSNLPVDTAMMLAATDGRPFTPSTLQRIEQEEEDEPESPNAASSLTPMFRSIYVGTD